MLNQKITPTMLRSNPDQVCFILNNLIAQANTPAPTPEKPKPVYVAGTNYIQFGDTLIQWGVNSGGRHDTDTSVSLPIAFSSSDYTLTITPTFPEGAAATSFWWAFVETKATSSFTYRVGYKNITASSGGSASGSNLRVSWIAIGKK